MVPLVGAGALLGAAIVVSRAPEAADCPDTDQLTARVERIVGRSLTAPAGSSALVVRADFKRDGGAYRATLQMSGAREGERVLGDEGPSCDALADAVAVTTALLFDASNRETLAERGTPGAPSWLERLRLSGRFGAGFGLVGGTTYLAGAGIEAALGPLTDVALGASLTGARQHQLGPGSVEVHLWYVELSAFRSLTGERFRLGPTASLMGGALSGIGDGYPLSSSASLAWFAAAAGLRTDVSAGAYVRLAARVVALVPARKQSFSIGYLGTAYESTPVGGAAEFMVSVKFW